MEKRKTRVVGYARVSTLQQADEGISMEVQELRLQQYADLFDLELVAIETDAGESAATLDRPGLQRALRRLNKFEAEGLLVVKLDRLTRSVKDLCSLVDTYFKDTKHSLMSVGEQIDTRSANGRMVLNILVTIGAWEREAIGERTKAALQHMKAQGRYCGGRVPYGKQLQGDVLVPDATETQVIELARALRATGSTLHEIAASLPASRSGKRFTPTQIVRML